MNGLIYYLGMFLFLSSKSISVLLGESDINYAKVKFHCEEGFKKFGVSGFSVLDFPARIHVLCQVKGGPS